MIMSVNYEEILKEIGEPIWIDVSEKSSETRKIVERVPVFVRGTSLYNMKTLSSILKPYGLDEKEVEYIRMLLHIRRT